MRKLKKIGKVFLSLIMVISLAFCAWTIFKPKEEVSTRKTEEEVQAEVNINEKILQEELEKSKRLVEQVYSDTEIILLEEKGRYTLFHDRTPNDNYWTEWLVNSEISFVVDYTAILSIETKKIKFSVNENEQQAEYNVEDIRVKAVNIDDITPITNKSLFGRSYLPTEISALTIIATEDIKNEIMSDIPTIFLANQNLKYFITNTALKFRIFNINIIENNELF